MRKRCLRTRHSGIGYFGVVALLHLVGAAGWLTAWRGEPAMLGMGLLAYSLGLRHAFDADHIAAIDNTVRKLLQQKRSSLGVGFYFSLGHSSVVFGMVAGVALSVRWLQSNLPQLERTGGLVGAVVSGSFLVIIGSFNLVLLIGMLKAIRRLRRGEGIEGERDAVPGGLMSRLTRPLLRFVNRSWHVYPLGFLFGLGFDTATEVGLLAVSASAAHGEVSIFGILSLPLLFAAGMSLMDTADGMMMTNAYRWSLSHPLRKLAYNATVTGASVLAALLIGTVELAQMLAEKLESRSPFLLWIRDWDFGYLGYAFTLLFLLLWGISALLWRDKRSAA